MKPLLPLPSHGSFASFSWPKYAWTLPKGSLRQRLERARNTCCGSYSHGLSVVSAGRNQASSFYLESDFMPGLRWQWADEACRSIRHKGWFTDEHGDSDTIRGLVMRLPSGRGFLAGYSMGEGMISTVDSSSSYPDEVSAALAADSMAQHAAETELEYQESAFPLMPDMKTKFTPGPWHYRPEEPSVEAQTEDGYDFWIAKCPESYSDAVPRDVAQANARLIAAAPTMFSALACAPLCDGTDAEIVAHLKAWLNGPARNALIQAQP